MSGTIYSHTVSSGEIMQLTHMPDDELHTQAIHYISQSNQLIFQDLPAIISQIIKQESWKTRINTFQSFGEYALNQSPEGLGVTNNEMLGLLKSAMKTQHAGHWAEVLCEVDTHVRKYAKEKNIPIKELSGNLTDYDSMPSDAMQENVITYLPSRSSSDDGRLLKLKKKDPEAYDNVIQNKLKLKEAWPQTPRKKLQPIESVKNKFASLSKSEREEFLAWIEQESLGA